MLFVGGVTCIWIWQTNQIRLMRVRRWHIKRACRPRQIVNTSIYSLINHPQSSMWPNVILYRDARSGPPMQSLDAREVSKTGRLSTGHHSLHCNQPPPTSMTTSTKMTVVFANAATCRPFVCWQRTRIRPFLEVFEGIGTSLGIVCPRRITLILYHSKMLAFQCTSLSFEIYLQFVVHFSGSCYIITFNGSTHA